MMEKKTLFKAGRKSSVLLSAIAISSGVTFFLCNRIYDNQIDEMQMQIDNLKKKELQARVTQRVSEQLEEIASQQTLISNKERDRAEEQSRIADMERGKAEIEKGLAMEAQKKALASAEEAQKARETAETQTLIAERNMRFAQDAYAHADTLLGISLSNSLAQSALAQSQVGNTDLARLLSYTSWYYAEKYQKKDGITENVYKALLSSSGTLDNTPNQLTGNIRHIQVVDGEVIAATDYGELLHIDKQGNRTSVKIGNYDIRDMITKSKDDNVAICSDGKLCKIDLSKLSAPYSGKNAAVGQTLQLPEDVWHYLISLDGGTTLVAMADRTVAWIDSKTFTLLSSKYFDQKLTTVGNQNGVLHIFGEKGMHYISETAGQAVDMPLLSVEDNNVVAYFYDKNKGHHFLGTSKGVIYILDRQGKKLTDLYGHTGVITDLHVAESPVGQLLFSLSYDSTLRIWNISDLSSLIMPISFGFDYWPLCLDVNQEDNKVWIGTQNGYSPNFCSDIIQNAQKTKTLLKREFTDEEWNYYVGKDIEKLKFLEK